MFSAPDTAVEMSLQSGSASGESEMLITAFPVEVQEKLNEIDEDGSGTLSCAELVHMVDMYHESKKTNKKMMCIIGGLLGLLVVALVAIGLITSFVVEGAKETKTDSSGVTLVAGTNTVAAAGLAKSASSIYDAASFSYSQLDGIEKLRVMDSSNNVISYQPVYWKAASDKSYVEFKTANAYVVRVTSGQALTVADENGNAIITSTPSMERRRLSSEKHLTNFAGALMTSGSFTMMAAGGGVR